MTEYIEKFKAWFATVDPETLPGAAIYAGLIVGGVALCLLIVGVIL